MLDKIQELKKALEAGSYNAAPGSLSQGAALQIEALDKVMHTITFQDKEIKLQKELPVIPWKSTLIQFNRELSYGQLGGSSVLEGQVGASHVGQYQRVVLPMAYYAAVYPHTIQAELVDTFDGKKPAERLAEAAALKIAADIEFHLFRGKDSYSNSGEFDGNPLVMSAEDPEMHGIDVQVRQADDLSSAKDLMLFEYGADASVVLNQSGILTNSVIEDAVARARMNHGSPEKLFIDPLTHAAYNKSTIANMQRIVLAGSPQRASGASLNEQFVASGTIAIESSRFLSGKTNAPAVQRTGSPSAPSISAAQVADSTSFTNGQVYRYAVSAVNEIGESALSSQVTVTISAAGNRVELTITPASGIQAKYFRVYRSVAGGTKLKYIGRVKNSGAATTIFVDKNKRQPGFVTGFGLDYKSMAIHELAPFSKMELARTQLATNYAFYRFCAIAVKAARFNFLIDNILDS